MLNRNIDMNIQKSITARTTLNALIAVSFELSKESMKKASNSNLVSSPLSIYILLSVIAAGSSGDTLHQLLSFLESETLDNLKLLCSEIIPFIFSDGSQIGGPKLSYAGGIWLERSLSLKPSFKQAVDVEFKSMVTGVDFINKACEALKEVNSWAEAKTGGLVKELLPSGAANKDSRLILANALYFKGVWDQKFDPSQTKHHVFHLPKDNPIQIPFMSSFDDQFIQVSNGFKVLRLPYQHGHNKLHFSMFIVLPDTQAEFLPLMDRLTSEPDFLIRHFPHEKVLVGKFRIPKFKFTFGFEASSLLKKLGLTLPFEMGGLTEIVSDEDEGKYLCVSKIFHRAAIEVNEGGTEAAAASAANMICGCSLNFEPPKTVDFVADHPFLFLIKEEITGVVLFFGHINNPLEER